MKAQRIFLLLVFLFPINFLMAQQDSSKLYFQQAFEELTAMLEGKQALDFERAVFITENAYRNNSIRYADFQAALEIHGNIIKQLMNVNSNHDLKQFTKASRGFALEKEEVVKERYRKALANWAIFTYLTDTTKIRKQDISFEHLPFTYSTEDPFGTSEWKNSQVSNLLETQRGNCYSLVTLFKIFSERLKTEANIVTAPQHIYIEHRDPRGDIYNVELATRSFPGTGSIEVLTYTTREALMNNIALRSLDLKQSIGLCLVYLAKGYENKFKTKDDAFLLACAEKALAHDTKNLNAMLLKAQVYEQRVMKNEMSAAPYEDMLGEFYKLGYRQMPDDMKNIIMAKIQGTPKPVTTDKTPETVNGLTRYVTLSDGLFEELHSHQKILLYGQTIFDTEKSKIVKFLDEDHSSYQIDPVVFALSIDPLTKSYPWYTPYQFAGNTPIKFIDMDGLEPAEPKQGAKYLVIVVQGYAGWVDPKNGATQSQNAVKNHPGAGIDDHLGSLSKLDDSETQVVVFASSNVENTKNDIAATIHGFVGKNKNSKVIAVGHSLGADNIIELVKEDPGIKLDLFIGIDATDLAGEIDDNNIPGNVANVINYRQTSDSRIKGEKFDILDAKTKSTDQVFKSDHDKLDDVLTPWIKDDIKNQMKDGNAVEKSQERYNGLKKKQSK